jgi:Trypsin-co-occurring domain 2
MKGRIDLGAFIQQIKKELVDAQAREEGFMELTDVELEVHFVLDVSGTAGMKLWVLDIGGKAKASQLHKVKLQFRPLPRTGPGGYGAEGSSGLGAPVSERSTHSAVDDAVRRALNKDLAERRPKTHLPIYEDPETK